MTARNYDLYLLHDGMEVAETMAEVDLDDRPVVYRHMAAMIERTHGQVPQEKIRAEYALVIHKYGSPYPETTFIPTEDDQDAR